MLEKLLVDAVGPLWAIVIAMVLAGILSSFIIEAFDRLNPLKKKAKLQGASDTVLIVHAWYVILAVTVFSTFIVSMAFRGLFDANPDPQIFEYDIWEVVFAALMNVTFAIVFYYLGGRRVVNKIVTKVGIEKVETELGKIK